MKKTVIIAILAAICTSFVFGGEGYTNQQRIIAVDSPVYKAMENLFIISGRSLPSSSGPWSENEMTLMLSYIDREQLDDTGKSYYDYVKSMVISVPKIRYRDNLAMQFGLDVNLEGYVHTNSEDFVDESDWFHGFTFRKPFLKVSFETWPVDSFYGYFELTAQHNYGYNVGLPADGGDNLLYKNKVNISIPILNAVLFSNELDKEGNTHTLADFDWTVPYRAFVSFGSNHWNFMAGRDRLSWGSGETGNLMLSQSFPKQTFARFNTYFEAFKYSIIATIYPDRNTEESQHKSLDGYKSLIVHRLEFNLFKNKVGLVINEACMFWSTKNEDGGWEHFNLAQINPFGFMHNEYIAGNANSLLVLEANYTPINGINVYGQLAIDEFNGPGEERANPPAFGILAGAKGAMTLGDGILNGSLEFAKTDPFLYLRGLNYSDKLADQKGYGFSAPLRIISCNRTTIQNKFVTYTYGNDAIILDGKVSYEVPNTYKVGFEAMYMVHGSMNADSYWGRYNGNDDKTPDVSTPTEFNPFDPDDYDRSTNTIKQKHAIERTMVISFNGEYTILDNLKAYGNIDLLFVTGQRNIKNANANDVQITLGASYSL